MATQMFVNLPVKSLERSVAFFTRLGYAFDAKFTDENATCMVIGDNMFVMLLVEPFFQTFTDKPVADASKATEVIVCISQDSRANVDALVDKAIEAGATSPNATQDFGFMYQRGYVDLDGHVWEVIHMESGGDAGD
jgi:predicted lactoylglutathione lyase